MHYAATKDLVVKRGSFTLGPISIEVDSGEGLAIAGRNGSGKTTLLESMSGALSPTSGGLWFMEKIVFGDRPHRKAHREAMHNVGVQLQSVELFERLTIEEHIQLFARLYNSDLTKYHKLIEDCPALRGQEDSLYNTLSAGKKQLLHIILAMGHSPKTLFLDEPTSGIDDDNKEWLWAVLIEFKQNGGAIVLSSHEGKEMDALGDKVLVLDDGQPSVLASRNDLTALLGYTTRLNILAPPDLPDEEIEKKLLSIDGIISAEKIAGLWAIASTDPISTAIKRTTILDETWEVKDSRKVGFQDLYEHHRRTGR